MKPLHSWDTQEVKPLFADCISFVVMRHQGLTQALTGNHHFEQAGFTALLK
jgi:predicted nucleic acid-binding protein